MSRSTFGVLVVAAVVFGQFLTGRECGKYVGWGRGGGRGAAVLQCGGLQCCCVRRVYLLGRRWADSHCPSVSHVCSRLLTLR